MSMRVWVTLFVTALSIGLVAAEISDKEKPKSIRIKGISEPMPLNAKARLKWRIKWIRKLNASAMLCVKAEFEKSKTSAEESLEKEQDKKNPKPEAVRYYTKLVKWHADLITSLDEIVAHKAVLPKILSDENLAQETKQAKLDEYKDMEKALVKEFKKVYGKKPRKKKSKR